MSDDSDSPSKASSSSDSSSSSEEERVIPAVQMPSTAADEESNAYADPESPNTAHQSSDESGSSDGVLVELPGNPDQDSRCLRGDQDSGILVNIDGSMQEHPEDDRTEDSGREEMFLDAPDQLGGAADGRNVGLEGSLAVIEIGESSGVRSSSGAEDLARIQARLDETLAECRKYKEEREVFGREVSGLHHQLQAMLERQSLVTVSNEELVEHLRRLEKGGAEDEALVSPTPLHSMVNDCSKFIIHLKSILDEQLNSEGAIRELHAVLYTKDQEIEDLNVQASEYDVARDVVASYLGSLLKSLKESSDISVKRLLASLASVSGQEFILENSNADGISIIEKRASFLIEKHVQLLSEAQQLGQFLAEVRPDLGTSQENTAFIFSVAREELLERKRKEDSLLEKISNLEEENRAMVEQIARVKEDLHVANAATNKTKKDLEQTENKLAVSKEKLSIAVTKGKTLVQHRDSLKQSLAEKTSELEMCLLKLQEKSDALEATEASTEELKVLLAEKTSELDKCLLELQQKSIALEITEDNAKELKQLLTEKTSELEKCFLEVQLKSDALENTKASAEELKQLLDEKSGELRNCMLELQQKSDSLETTGKSAEALKQALAEKMIELEMCLLELQQKSDAMEASEASTEELKQSLAMKSIELEKCLLELQQKSDTLETSITTSVKMNETQNLVNSLQASLSTQNMLLQQIEEVMHHYIDSSPDLLSMDIVDRVRWFVNQKQISDGVLVESHKVRDALSSIDLLETISSTELHSQVDWLVKSFTLAKEDIIKMQHEIYSAQAALTSHGSELFEARKEIDHLVASLLELKQEKDSLRTEHEDMKCKYEKIAEILSSISFEKSGFMDELTEASAATLDNQPCLNTEMIIQRCIGTIQERMKSSLTERQQFERMQSLLYVKDQERMLYEKILEEEVISRSVMTSLSNELGRALEEVITLRNEKESLKKELERVEEKCSLLREKLSMAVKKGKGLVQEREGFKHSLDEKNSEIEKLKQDLKLQESSIVEYKEQLNSLSSYPDHIQKLELEVASLKDQREQSERFLLESNNTLQRLVESIEEIVLPTDKIFEGTIEKVYWITQHINELEVAKAYVEQELEKIKVEAALQANRLADALGTIKSLEDEISNAEKHIRTFAEEKKGMQFSKANMEQELEKFKEEGCLQATKLADSCATIKSLEDALAQSQENVNVLDRENREGKQEIIALNTKLIECMQELAETRGSFENQSAELVSYLGHLQMLMKDEALFSLMTEEFRKKIEGLRHIGLLIQDIHDQCSVKGLLIHTGSELQQVPDFASISSLPKFEDFINDGIHGDISKDDDITSFTKIVEGFHVQAQHLGDRFKDLSGYMDNHIALALQALQATRDEVIHMLDLGYSLKLNVDNLEAHKQAQEAKIISLEKDTVMLLSACTDSVHELQIDLNNLINFCSDQDMSNSSLVLSSAAVGGGLEEGDAGEYVKVAESLLFTAKRIRTYSQQIVNVKRVWETSIDDLKYKLKQAEVTAETAIQDRHLSQERLVKLEEDLKELQNICSELKGRINDHQVKEDAFRDKEAELLSLQCTLTAKDTGISGKLFSEGQLEMLIDKVDKMAIPFIDSEVPTQEVIFPSPVVKLFYIVDKVTELQHRMSDLTYEKENMGVILASHIREIEHLKEATETIGTNYQDLESRRMELIELTVGLEKIIQKFGSNYLFEDQKPITATGFLPVLDRLMTASSMEIENSKSRIQDLGAKLQLKEKVVDELSTKTKLLEESIQARLAQADTAKERTVFEASSAAMGSEISEIEDVGPLGKNLVSPVSTAAHVRTMRKGSNDHLVLSVDSEASQLIASQETEDKGHVFKSLNTSGLIPKQGKLIADRVDGIWVSGGRILMRRPGARLSLIAYWIFLHLWVLGTLL